MSQLKIISLDNLKYIINYLKTKFTAPMASCDAAGNNIQETYLKKTGKAVDAVHADDADKATKATKATNDALGREISKTYVSVAGGKVDGELHVQQPADDDRSDKPATTSWTANLLAHTLPSKKRGWFPSDLGHQRIRKCGDSNESRYGCRGGTRRKRRRGKACGKC